MCISRKMSFLVGFSMVLEIAGCAQERSVRTGPRSVASIGDKTDVIVSGEPGASIASTVPDYPGDRLRDSKISGRVVDDHGRGVANAKVRMAIAGTKGGRVESVKADSSGAFTLHRLKPGSSYVLIAEAVDGEETLTGRIEAKAPQTSLKIRMLPQVDGSDHFRTSSNSARAKIGTASNIEDEEEEEIAQPKRSSSRINREDFEPPAPEAESIKSRPKRSTEVDIQDEPDEGEKVELPKSPPPRRKKKAQIPASLHPDSSERGRALPEVEDDGENPLPPAIERKSADETTQAEGDKSKTNRKQKQLAFDQPDAAPVELQVTQSRASETSAPPKTLVREPDSPEDHGLKDLQVIAASATSVESVNASQQSYIQTPHLIREEQPANLFQTPHLIREERSASHFQTPQFDSNPGTSRLLEEAGSVFSDKRALNTAAVDDADLDRDPESSGRTKRMQWGELDPGQVVPLDESLCKRSARVAHSESRPKATSKPDESSLKQGGLSTGFFRSRIAAPAPIVNCRYDNANRRLHDFQLPDAQGQIVSLKDFESDLILLDFWGTWCAPCKTSIPHLLEFQNRFGKDRLQIIGIACERAPANKRSDLVLKAQKEFGITYPLLITGKDGPCALQEALQVQFYPTMILLNRKGQILWREQGATEKTLAHIEDAILTSLKNPASGRELATRARPSR